MFALRDADLDRSMLGVGDGPASFNAEMTAAGRRVISIDPLYMFAGQEIRQRFDASIDVVMSQVLASPDDWTWSFHASPDHLRRNRIAATERFLADYEAGRRAGRYLAASLPTLPFANGAFELALCSHLLFLYTDLLGEAFHHQAVAEIMRVADELRIFPLLTLGRERSPLIDPVCASLERRGYQCSIERVAYELQRGGNQMLRVKRRS
jgi:hypothetical protein